MFNSCARMLFSTKASYCLKHFNLSFIFVLPLPVPVAVAVPVLCRLWLCLAGILHVKTATGRIGDKQNGDTPKR